MPKAKPGISHELNVFSPKGEAGVLARFDSAPLGEAFPAATGQGKDVGLGFYLQANKPPPGGVPFSDKEALALWRFLTKALLARKVAVSDELEFYARAADSKIETIEVVK